MMATPMGATMKRTVAAALAVALLLGACGDGGNEEERAETVPAEGAEEEAPTEAEPKAADAMLLTVADMPTGYSEKTPAPEEDDNSPAPCPEFENIEELESDSEAERNFTKGEPSLFGAAELSQEVHVFNSSDEITERFGAFVKLLENPECRTFDTTDADATFKGTLTPLSFPKLGDDTLAMHMAAQVSSEGIDLPIALDIVVFRKGRALNLLSTVGYGASMIPTTELEVVARKALDKM